MTSTRNIHNSLNTAVSTRPKRKQDENVGIDPSSSSAFEGKESQDESRRRVSKRQRRESSSICHCATPEHEAQVDLEIERLEEIERSNQNRMKGHYWGRVAFHGSMAADVKTITRNPAVLMSPGEPIRKELKAEGCSSISKMQKKDISENGTPKRLVSESGEELFLVYKTKLTMPASDESKSEQEVVIAYYQSEKGAARNKKLANVKPEDKKKAESCPKPASKHYRIDKDEITPEKLEEAKDSKHEISGQYKPFKASAIAANFGFAGDHDTFEHSHMEAHRHGQNPAKAVMENPTDTDAKMQDAVDTRELITIPARREHNSLRLVTAEIPAIAECIQFLKKLYFSVDTHLLQDTNGMPVPIIASEKITWQNEEGTRKIEFVYNNALQTIKPLAKFEKLNTRLMKALFGVPEPEENAGASSMIVGNDFEDDVEPKSSPHPF